MSTNEQAHQDGVRIPRWSIPAAAAVLVLCACVAVALVSAAWIANVPSWRLVSNPSSQDTRSKVVGAQGGEITDSAGFRLTIPRGALLEDTSISSTTEPNPPAMPASVTAAGQAYRVDLPAGTRFLFPVDVLLPLVRQPGVSDSAYSAFVWDGSQWARAGGTVEGNAIRLSVFHFSIYQPGVDRYDPNEFRSVLFRHNVPDPRDYRVTGVIAWQYVLDDVPLVDSPLHVERLYIPVQMSGVRYPGLWNAAIYPAGVYTLWCVEWAEPENGPAGNRLQTYHMFVGSNVRPAFRIEDWISGQEEPPEVGYTLPAVGGGVRDECGMDSGDPPMGIPGQPINAPNLSPAEQAATAAAQTVQAILTALPGATPTNSAIVPAPASPAAHPTAPAQAVLDIWKFVVSSEGTLENNGTDTIGMIHLGDQVTLRGPITILVDVHRHVIDAQGNIGPEIPVSTDVVVIANGDTWSYYLDEASPQHPGDWDASIKLLSIDQ